MTNPVAEKKYKTKPLDCWNKAKELRLNYYKNYAAAHDKGGLRWAGGAWVFDAVPYGLGDDVYPLTSEPYGASIGNDPAFALECMEATEAKGWARDLCSYMRCYWGSIILDKYAFGGKFPKPDFIWQDHICCSHAKWYQVVKDLEGEDIPYYCFDVSVGPQGHIGKHGVDYVVGQLLDGVEWMQKVTGRKYDDEKLIQAVYNTCRSTALWAEVCKLNQAIPAPLDEKSMYSLYVLGTLSKAAKWCGDFYEELRDEVKDRVANKIAAVGNERSRLFSDSQPPWAALKIYRYLEKFGCVSVGSIYTFGLIGSWDVLEDGTLAVPKTPQEQGIVLKTREEALTTLAEWELKKIMWLAYYGAKWKNKVMLKAVKDWHVDAVVIHLNRGCEGTVLGQMENRLALINAGVPVMTYEGNMADFREFDEAATTKRFDAFMETLGLKQLEA